MKESDKHASNVSENTKEPAEKLIIKESAQVSQIMHEKKQLILLEIFRIPLTIQDLKIKTGMNPGTIKRHLDDLMAHNLVYVQRTERNEYNILMKYYRAQAKKFIINICLPDDAQCKNSED